MQNYYLCSYLEHLEESIVGFCLNDKCKYQSQFCLKCFSSYHLDHQDDCLNFEHIFLSINIIQEAQTDFLKKIQNLAFELQSQVQQITQRILGENKKLMELKNNLSNCFYFQVKSEMPFLKSINKEIKEKKSTYILEQLDATVISLQAFNKVILTMRRDQEEFQIRVQEKKKAKIYDKQLILEIIEQGENFRVIIGKTLFDLQQFTEALDQFERALRMDYYNNEAIFQKGKTLLELDKPIEALDCFDKITENDQEPKQCYLERGLALFYLSRFEEAITFFDRAIQFNQILTLPYIRKGQALLSQGHYEEAIFSFEKCINIDPNNQEAILNKGLALSNLGKYQDAISQFNQVIFLNQSLSDAHYYKGIALVELELFDDALDSFSVVIRINPSYLDAYIQKSDVLLIQNKLTEAVEFCNFFLEQNNLNEDILFNKGDALLRLKQYNDAYQCFQKVTDFDFQDHEAHFKKSQALVGLKNYPQALDSINQAILISEQQMYFAFRAKIQDQTEQLAKALSGFYEETTKEN